MKRSETSETVGNMIRPKFVEPAFLFKINISAQRSFFLKVQRCPRGNGWKQSEIAPSLGKKHMFLHNFQTFFMNMCYKTTTFLPSEGAISDCFQPFPLGHLWTFKKKTSLRGNASLQKNAGWTSFGLIMFPTVSDRFIFSERLIGPVPFVEGWSSASPCKPWRLSFFVRPLCVYTAPNIASWPWYPIFPKNHKIPGAREI